MRTISATVQFRVGIIEACGLVDDGDTGDVEGGGCVAVGLSPV